MSLEKYLIDHCAPTLASLKMGSLFTVDYESEAELYDHVAEWNRTLGGKGVCMTVLRLGGNDRQTALIYVYRRRKLRETLGREDVMDFLEGCGYDGLNGVNGLNGGDEASGSGSDWVVERALEILRFHLAEGGFSHEFPHEIGVFLDYPLGDVIGFIENRGKDLNVRDAGRCMLTQAARRSCLASSKNARWCTGTCGRRAGVSAS